MDVLISVITTFGSIVVATISVGLPLLASSKKSRQAETQKILDLVKQLQADLANNTQLTVGNARTQMESIYRKYKKDKAMPESSWKAVCELHSYYKQIVLPDGHRPNSWADDLFNEMETWEKLI